MAASLPSGQDAQQAEMTRKEFRLARRIGVDLGCRSRTEGISRKLNRKGTDMAEETNWKKWEGPGEPEGKGGMSTPESSQPEEVEGRGRKMAMITCYLCGATGAIEHDAQWYTCWKCGGTATTMVG
jgi:hypothetical protein